MKQSHTTGDLLSYVNRIKEDKKNIESQLKVKINENEEYLADNHNKNIKINEKLKMKRDFSIGILEKKLMHKHSMDEKTDLKLYEMQKAQKFKKSNLERRINEISQRNQQRIKQIKQIEENVIKKINQDIKKHQYKEKHLRTQFLRIKNEEKKIKQTKQFQKKAASQQWKVLINQKWKLQNLAKEYEDKQQVLIHQKNPQVVRKEKKKVSVDDQRLKYLQKDNGKQKIKKQIKKIDSKKVGNQYLDQIKKMQKEIVRQRKPKKLMNINLKVIGYNQQIMDKISRNTGDLSKFTATIPKKQQKSQKSQRSQRSQRSQVASASTIKQSKRKTPIDFDFEDEQTKKNLRQIKQNLKVLQVKQDENPQIENSPSQLPQEIVS